MANEWIDDIRKISIQAMEAGRPCDVILGTVIGAVPVSVQVDQKTTLMGPQLIVPRHLTDHTEQMSIPGVGNVAVTVRNGLKSGEQVILIQKRGGQQYLIADRY